MVDVMTFSLAICAQIYCFILLRGIKRLEARIHRLEAATDAE